MALYSVAGLTQIKPADLTIVQRIIPWSNRNRPGAKLNTGLQWELTQHTTGNENVWADAESHVTFCIRDQGGSGNVSFHIVHDDDLTVYQLLPFDEAGYHAGDGMDSWWGDVGGWGSIAMETCVNMIRDPARWLRCQQVAAATWASVLIGDPRWDFGTGGPERFSVDRYVPHYKQSDDKKWCPAPMLNNGNIRTDGTGPMREAIRLLAGLGGADVPDGYPEGMDYGVARMLFGRVIGDDGKVYAFNEQGAISQRWIEYGKESGVWPQLVEVRHFDTRVYFRFSNGLTYWRSGSGPIKELAA